MNSVDLNETQKPHDYVSYREKWVHEDDLINHRLNWLLMTQTILFAAYGLLLDNQPDTTANDNLGRNVDALIKVLPYLGIAVSGLIFLGVLGAVGAMYALRRNRTKEVKEMDIDAALWTSILGQLTGLLLPIVFIAAWLFV